MFLAFVCFTMMYHDTEFNLPFSLFTENSGDSTVTGGSHYGIVHLNTFRRDQQFMINKNLNVMKRSSVVIKTVIVIKFTHRHHEDL